MKIKIPYMPLKELEFSGTKLGIGCATLACIAGLTFAWSYTSKSIERIESLECQNAALEQKIDSMVNVPGVKPLLWEKYSVVGKPGCPNKYYYFRDDKTIFPNGNLE